MRISDWSSDVCSSDLDLIASVLENDGRLSRQIERMRSSNCRCSLIVEGGLMRKYHPKVPITKRSEEHTSELQSLMRISSAVFCLKKKKLEHNTEYNDTVLHKQNTI